MKRLIILISLCFSGVACLSQAAIPKQTNKEAAIPELTDQEKKQIAKNVQHLKLNKECKGCDLRQTNMNNLNLLNANLENANLESAQLNGAYLVGANLKGTNLNNIIAPNIRSKQRK